MTIFRYFQGPRPRRDIGIARPRHSKTCLETETRLETSSSDIYVHIWTGRYIKTLGTPGLIFRGAPRFFVGLMLTVAVHFFVGDAS